MLRLHQKLERHTGLLIFGILAVASIGGLVQVLPIVMQPVAAPATGPAAAPHTPLQLAGRGVYIRESCMLCHSQQVRPLLAEVKRYGPYSRAEEFVFERPFLWGSKRTGPDLHRVGGRFSDAWHRAHLINPRRVVPGSVMPAYPWLATRQVDAAALQSRMRALRVLGHPYTDADLTAAANIAATEMDALIAYLQSLGAGAAQ